MKKILVSAILLSVSGVASANLVVNGSFEDPSISDPSWTILSGIPGWSSTFGIELRRNIVGSASDGFNFVELDTTRNSSMSQTITTTANTLYNLSFDYSPRIGQSFRTNGISAFWNGNLLTNVTATGGTVNNWFTLSFDVTGTGNDTLRFAATGISDSLGGNLDNVTMNAVPLPAALPMALSGLGVLGFAARRRKSAAV